MAVTESEKYLETLAKKSFLSMWSYANPAFGNPSSKKGGKELCDLLVLFRNNVILFSDKRCRYPDGPDATLNWSRWYRRSICKSIDQLLGARKTLSQAAPDVFTDTSLRSRFPLPLPPAHEIQFFLVAVSHETGPVCHREYGRDSLKIDTRLNRDDVEPLTVGCRFDGHFVHILDDSTLDIILKNRDTIVDFIHYLEQKEDALTRNQFVIHGEENLLALYASHRKSDGEHFIPTASGTELVVVDDGAWNALIGSESYRESIEANGISYNIDMLIEHFTKSYLTGQMIEGQQHPLSHHEEALRMMASESRFGRRTISTAFVSILKEEVTTTFWASTAPSFATTGLRYVFLTYPDPPAEIELEHFEGCLLEHLSQHLLVARHVFPESTTLIGFAVPNPDCRMTTTIIRILDGTNWTADDHAEAAALQKATGLFANMVAEHFVHFE